MASVIVIGVGTTGLDVLERAQQYYYEFTKAEGPDNASFMFIDTAKREPKTTPNGKTKIQKCHIGTDNIESILSQWRQSKKYDWLPSDAEVLNQHDGAANQPAIGRVALWANSDAVYAKIHQAYEDVQGDADTNIYIVGSLTGGTGTGIFMDLAYLTRKACSGNQNIYGMFLLPNRHQVGSDGMDLLYENAYTSLRTLDYYSVSKNAIDAEDAASNYECVLPNGTSLNSAKVPFKNAQFFTQDFSNEDASLKTLTQLIQSVSFNLVLRLLEVNNQGAAVQSTVNSKKVDYFSFVKKGLYTTVGMNVYQYPEALLEEYLTTSLIERDILNRWVDQENYIDAHGEKYSLQTIKARIKNDSKRFVQEEIEAAIEKCKGAPILGKPTFESALKEEIEVIISGNFSVPRENYIFSLLSADSKAAKFYAAITGNATNLRDELITAITKKIYTESTSLQNLSAVDMYLQGITEALETVLKDWKTRYKLDGTPNQWNKVWSALYDNRFAGKALYAMTGLKAEWYAEAIEGAATLCYFNSFIPMIDNIISSLLNRNGQRSIASASGIHLPTMRDLIQLHKKVENLLNSQDDESLVARRANIHGQMSNDSNRQMIFLFNGQDCDADVQVAEGKYLSQPERLDFSKISKDSLWEFLENDDEIGIKSALISRGLFFIQKMNLFANTDIVKIMEKLPKEHKAFNRVRRLLTDTPQVIVKDLPAMVHLVDEEQFYPQDSLKLIVMSHLSEDNQDGIVNLMEKFKPSVTQRNYIQLPSMKNTVVVYQEYGYMGSVNGVAKAFNPLIHICYQKQVFEKICEKIDNKAFDASMRLAYIDIKTLKDTKNVKIK